METTMRTIGVESIGTGFTRKLVEDWVNSCNDFLQWQRREVIEKKPSPEKLAEHRDALKLMLRLGHGLQAQVSDPDFPLRQCGWLPERLQCAGSLPRPVEPEAQRSDAEHLPARGRTGRWHRRN